MIVVGNRPTQDHFSKVSIYNFSGLKKYKKEYIEMTKKIYLETFEKCPRSVYFPLLIDSLEAVSVLKRSKKEKRLGNWEEKALHGQYLRQTKEIRMEI